MEDELLSLPFKQLWRSLPEKTTEVVTSLGRDLKPAHCETWFNYYLLEEDVRGEDPGAVPSRNARENKLAVLSTLVYHGARAEPELLETKKTREDEVFQAV